MYNADYFMRNAWAVEGGVIVTFQVTRTEIYISLFTSYERELHHYAIIVRLCVVIEAFST